jgi:hypothetical protein
MLKERLEDVMNTRFLLHIDGAAILTVSIFLYARLGGPWWLFAVLLLAPDVFMLGYLKGPKIGAVVYNLGHTLAAPLIVGAVGVITGADFLLMIALIWAAHIGMDHLFGYGLKYPTRFKDTHLQRI